MKNFTIFVSILFAISIKLAAQDTKDIPKYFGETFRIDSVETLLLTVQYNSDLYSGKFTFDDYYGNIIFYNYKKNTKKRLFETDTYIRPFRRRDYYRYNFSESNKLPENFAFGQIYFFVNNIDFDNNNKITGTDPSVLYTCDYEGKNLIAITPENENAISFDLFQEQGFMLIKMQRDHNKDMDFTYKDKDFYYLKVDLHTYKIIDKIEL